MPRAARNTWRGAGLGLTLPEPPPPRKHPPSLGCTIPRSPATGAPQNRPRAPGGDFCSPVRGMLVPEGGPDGRSSDKRHTQGARGTLGAESGRSRESSPCTPRLRSRQRGNAEAPPRPGAAVPEPAPQAPGWYRLRGGAGSGRALPQPQAAASPTLCLFLNHGLHFKAILPM